MIRDCRGLKDLSAWAVTGRPSSVILRHEGEVFLELWRRIKRLLIDGFMHTSTIIKLTKQLIKIQKGGNNNSKSSQLNTHQEKEPSEEVPRKTNIISTDKSNMSQTVNKNISRK